jgi:ankyrin repeat protein
MKLFIKKGYKITPELLSAAAISATPEMLELLLRYYPTKKLKGMFLLHNAIAYYRVQNVRVLIESGVDVNELPSEPFNNSSRGDAERQTALHLAAGDERIAIAKLLLKGGARIDILDSEGRTAPEKARMNNQVEVEKLMLGMGTKGKKDERGWGWINGILRRGNLKAKLKELQKSISMR